MAKKTADQHKPRRMVALPESVASELELMARENLEKLTPLVLRICIQHLKDKGRWPPQRHPKP